MGLAVLLSTLTVRAIESSTIRDEAQVAAELVLRTVSPQLRPGDFKGDLPSERRKLLDGLFLAHGISDRALRIRLWRADGQLLYSNSADPKTTKLTGVDFAKDNGFAEFVERYRRFDSTAPDVVRFFVPIKEAGNPKTLAAFEIFYDLTHLQMQLGHIRRTVWTAVPTGILALYASVFVLVRRASNRLMKQQADLISAHLGTYQALASAIDAKDSYTGDHSTNVSDLAVQMAQTLQLPPQGVEEVRIAARLHDLGKIAVPDSILMKPARLTPEEWAVMRQHAERGFEILRKAPLPESAKLAIRHSHERWNGLGYPDGLAGGLIPLTARIVAVVDAFEAMTSDRPYRRAMPVQDALAELEKNAGSQFDSHIVRVFVQMIRRIKELPEFRPTSAAAG